MVPEGGPGRVRLAPGKLLIPDRYISPMNSGLKVNVQEGPNNADFDLKD
jgi:hypothetical protein